MILLCPIKDINLLLRWIYKYINSMSLLLSKILGRFSAVKDTCLKQLHLDNKGKLVEFAGSYLST